MIRHGRRFIDPILLLLAGNLFAQADFEAEPISVTASRLHASLVSSAREVTVISSDQIRNAPAATLMDLFYASGLDVSRRGLGGMQSDLSLRGSTFEQVLILVDGVRMNDPQTGHYHGDVSLPLSNVERIEILNGPSASLFGPDGFGGVIHIITRSAQKSRTNLKVSGGNFGTLGFEAMQQFSVGPLHQSLSFSRQKSDGYMKETGVDTKNIAWQGDLQTGRTCFSWGLLGWDKSFGANGFYAPYPSHEKTRALQGRASVQMQADANTKWEIKAFSRSHHNTFILIADDPGYYTNRHDSRITGAEAVLNKKLSEKVETVLGLAYDYESLESSNLGNHHRDRTGVFGEAALHPCQNWVIHSSARLDRWAGAWIFNPALSASWKMNEQWKWHSSVGRTYRTPNFTELYYHSPTNIGHADLKPEWAVSGESGLSWNGKTTVWETTGFLRREHRRIDWIVREPGLFEAANLPEASVAGISARWQQKWTGWMESSLKGELYHRHFKGYEEADLKYGPAALFKMLQANVLFYLPLEMSLRTIITVKDRALLKDYTTVDSRLMIPISKAIFYLEGTNLLDETYTESYAVLMPGRSWNIGIQFNP